MARNSSLFSQIVSLFDRIRFRNLVTKHKAENRSKGFASWDHFVSMIFCQLAQAKSLREICGGLACCEGKLRHLGMNEAPKKSTLSYANANRPWKMFEDLFYETLGICSLAAPGKHKFRFKNKLLSMDSSTISLCLSIFPWAKFRQTKGAVKLHLLLDHDGYLPVFANITEGKQADVHFAWDIPLSAGSIIVMDRGYNDYLLFNHWTTRGVFFVTRLKENASYEIVEERPVPKNRNILADQIILFSEDQARKDCPIRLRKVVVWDAEKEREIVLLTNHMEFGPTTISSIYKDRWQIELFFKALKQNLKVKTFVGTSENALYIQIWTALVAMLIIKYIQFRSKFGWSLSNLVALLRWNLFTYRDLWEWADKPYDVLPIPPDPLWNQMELPGFGQHPNKRRPQIRKK